MTADTPPPPRNDCRPAPCAPPPPGLVARLLMLLIRIYQLTLSAFLGRHCRHLPTCSQYARQAIARHGAWAGFWLGLWRVLRCHPWGTHGFDPVPEQHVPRHDLRFWRYRRFGACPQPGHHHVGNDAHATTHAERE